MKHRFNGSTWLVLGISLAIALFMSPWASSSPDGLEKMAQINDFSHKGEEWTLWNHAPLRDYGIQWISDGKGAKGVSGFIGTLAIFLLVLGFGRLLRK